VLVLAVVGSSAGCSLLDRRERVAVVGDSISFQVTDELEAALDDRYRVRIEAVPGITIGGQLETAAEVGGETPRQVIVNLGTNDASLVGAPTQDSVNALSAMLDSFAGVTCVHLTTVYEGLPPATDHDPAALAAALNADIRRIADEQDYDVIDWNAIVVDNGGAEEVLVDRVHPTELGESLLVDANADALRRCPESTS
jgi:lysophospholipase L1-like esterase